MLWKRKDSPRYACWDQLSSDQKAAAADALVPLCAALFERSGDLVVSPGSSNSVSFLRALLAYSSSIKSQPVTSDILDKYRQEIEASFKEFGVWQRQSVEELIRDISDSAHNLIGTVSTAIEDGDESVSLMRRLASGLEEAKNLDDIVSLRQVVRMQIEVAKELVVKQSEMQKKLTAAQEKELAVLEKKLTDAESASHTDYLTQLANRAAFDYYASAMIQKAKYEGAEVALAMLDLDSFKDINDTHGHQAGDAALNEAAGLLKRFLGAQAFVARFGGDEFAIAWMGTCNDLRGRISSLIRHVSTKKIKLDAGEGKDAVVNLGFSAGVAGVLESDSLQAVLARADKALYESKKAGKGRVTMEDRRAA